MHISWTFLFINHYISFHTKVVAVVVVVVVRCRCRCFTYMCISYTVCIFMKFLCQFFSSLPSFYLPFPIKCNKLKQSLAICKHIYTHIHRKTQIIIRNPNAIWLFRFFILLLFKINQGNIYMARHGRHYNYLTPFFVHTKKKSYTHTQAHAYTRARSHSYNSVCISSLLDWAFSRLCVCVYTRNPSCHFIHASYASHAISVRFNAYNCTAAHAFVSFRFVFIKIDQIQLSLSHPYVFHVYRTHRERTYMLSKVCCSSNSSFIVVVCECECVLNFRYIRTFSFFHDSVSLLSLSLMHTHTNALWLRNFISKNNTHKLSFGFRSISFSLSILLAPSSERARERISIQSIDRKGGATTVCAHTIHTFPSIALARAQAKFTHAHTHKHAHTLIDCDTYRCWHVYVFKDGEENKKYRKIRRRRRRGRRREEEQKEI